MRTWHLMVSPLACAVMACGGSSAGVKTEAPTPAVVEHAPQPEATLQPASTEGGRPVAAEPAEVVVLDDSALKLPMEAPLAAEVNAGVIVRADLDDVLARGISHFCQSVPTQAHLVRGRFVGWRILSLFADRPDLHVAVLRPGDIVRKANGQSLERPEMFVAVWESLGKARELVLDIDRDGRSSKLRYTIAN